jgi:hypothetical protein
VDLRLVRLLARHFHDLHGARTVSIAVPLQIAAAVWLRTGSLWLVYACGAAALAGVALLSWPAVRYYRRFGTIVTRKSPRLIGWFSAGIVFALRVQSHVLVSFPNGVWLFGAALAAWLAWDSRPYRWHWLLVAAAAVYVAFGSVGDRNGDFTWMAARMWAFSLSLVVAGLCDHALLVWALRTTSVAAEDAS